MTTIKDIMSVNETLLSWDPEDMELVRVGQMTVEEYVEKHRLDNAPKDVLPQVVDDIE